MSFDYPELWKAREISALEESATIVDAIKLALEWDNIISRWEMWSLYAKFQWERQALDVQLRSMKTQISEQAQKQWKRLWEEVVPDATVADATVADATAADATDGEAPVSEEQAAVTTQAVDTWPVNKFDLTQVQPNVDEALKWKEYEVNVNSKLNIRDQNWKIISNMKKWEKVILTWNKKEVNNVTFVEVDNNKYVSLQYLKPLVKPIVSTEQQQTTDTPADTAQVSDDQSTIVESSNVAVQDSPEVLKIDLSKWVNIIWENWYIWFKNMSWISDLPDWKDLPAEIRDDKTWKLLSMSVEDGKVNVYFWEKRVNQEQNQYTWEASFKQEYVMKYGEIVNWKFEKTPIWWIFAYDDLANNIVSK